MLMLDGMPAVRVKTELLESEQGVSRGFYVCGFIFQQAGDLSQATLWLVGPPVVLPFSLLPFWSSFSWKMWCCDLIYWEHKTLWTIG